MDPTLVTNDKFNCFVLKNGYQTRLPVTFLSVKEKMNPKSAGVSSTVQFSLFT